MVKRYSLFVLLLGCSGGSDDTGDTTDKPDATITIVSPTDGQVFAHGDSVPLEVKAKRGTHAVDVTRATWTIDDWTATGTTADATGLSDGAHTVSVEAVVEGTTLTSSVEITVQAHEGDTDTDADTDTDVDFTYGGQLDANVTVDSPDYGTFDDTCSTPISFTLDDHVIAGAGNCHVFDDFGGVDIAFTMDGTVYGGTVDGALVMLKDDGSEARTPFTGTGNAGSQLTATFDGSFSSPDGSLRIQGSWTGSPL
jgi:hypothetical protein